MVTTRNGTNTERIRRFFSVGNIRFYYPSDTDDEFSDIETGYEIIDQNEEILVDINNMPPSYDYFMGEILATEHLPSYEDLDIYLPTYEDVQNEKFWEKKKYLEKKIKQLEYQKEHLYLMKKCFYQLF